MKINEEIEEAGITSAFVWIVTKDKWRNPRMWPLQNCIATEYRLSGFCGSELLFS